MMKPSAPISSALASIHYVHSTLFEYQAPIASKTTSQTPFFVCVFQLLASQIQLTAPRVSKYK